MSALVVRSPTVQRAMYLHNEDDLIYKDSNNPQAEYGYVHKSQSGHRFYIDYANVAPLQQAVAVAALGWPNDRARNRFFDDLVANVGANDPHAVAVRRALGTIWAYDNGALIDVSARLDPYVVGHIASVAGTRGPQYDNVGGGSRLPPAEGVLIHRNDVGRDVVLRWLGVGAADLPGVQAHSLSPQAMQSAADQMRAHGGFTRLEEFKLDPGGQGGPDVIYGSRVLQRRSANARVWCAGRSRRLDLTDLGPGDMATTTQSFNTLPAVHATSGWVPGTQLVPMARGQGQVAAMNDWNALGAAAFANTAAGGNRNYNLDQNWEWLHVRGAQIGGITSGGNLVAGIYATNSAMIPFESMVAAWAGAGGGAGRHTFWAKFDAQPGPSAGFATQLSISIRAQGHPDLGNATFDPLVRFDPVTGQVVDRVAAELIKRNLDRTRRVGAF